MYLSDIATIPLNLAGFAGISIPCGLASGLPVGLQIVVDFLQEPKLLQLSHHFEKAFNFQRVSV
jgi:aspartyl-tRNA(Asn)/glutamyl-tRNA(Gln) amidotransferase subunit A